MSLKKAIELANEKKFNQAKEMLEELAKEYPNDPDILYNLGMCYTELNNPEKAIEVLTKGIVIAPELVNSHVALGFAFTKLGDLIEAESHFRNALEIQPDNSYALRNLGGLLAKKKDYEGAIEFLIKSLMKHPDDMRTTYGLGLAYFHTKKLNEADEQFKIVISNSNDNYLIDLAKDFRRNIAELNLKSDGLRTDAMFYCLGAMEYFKDMPVQDIQKIAFEIGMKGQSGLSVNNPSKKYTLKTMQGEFTGLQLVCYMFVGFKSFAPEQDIGMDFSEEYRMAKQFFKE